MYLTLDSLLRMPLAEKAELFQKVLVQHAGKFYYIELNALGQAVLGEIPQQIQQLKDNPAPSPWARPIVLRVTGAASGTVTLDGTQDVQMEVQLNHDAISVEDIDGLGMILLGMQRRLEEQEGRTTDAKTAERLAKAITITADGDISGKLEKFDGSGDARFTLKISDTLRNQLKNSFLGTIGIPNPDANAITYQGTVAVTDGVNFPQSSGFLWNAFAPSKEGGQFYQGTEGRLWHRMLRPETNVAWTEVLTRATFDPESKADKVDSLGSVRESKDLEGQSTSALTRWNETAKNAPSSRGVYLETLSASGRREPMVGNQLDRLMFSADGRLFHQQNVDNKGWTRRELYHSGNFNPDNKANLTNPSFRSGVGIYPGAATSSQNLLHMGNVTGKPRWKLDLESDGSLTLNAYGQDQKEQHRLLRLRSRLASGKNEVEVLANRTRIGLGGLTAIYGFEHDDWGVFSSKTTIGFTDGKQAVTYLTKHDRVLVHEGSLEVDDRVEARRIYAQWDAGVDGGISCDNWFRSAGNSGWMNSTYGGGWYMRDERYVRTYNDKRVLAGGYSMSFRNASRASITPLHYNGGLQPIKFYNIDEGVHDYGFDLEQLKQLYPEAVETRDGQTFVSIHAVGAILSVQNNKIENDIGDTNSEVDQLKERIRVLEERFAELGL